MRVLIIEDSEIELENLKILLTEFEGFDLIGTADTIREGIERANQERPDLLFLDIQLECKNSLEHIHKLEFSPYIICTTLHDSHALEAFEVGVTDYLTKPLSHQKLCRSLKRLQGSIRLAHHVQKEASIPLNNGNTIEQVKFAEILHVTSDRDYTVVHIENNKNFLCTRRLREWAELLPSNLFTSLDRSTMINRDRVIAYSRPNESNLAKVTFQNGQTLEIGTTAYRRLKEVL